MRSRLAQLPHSGYLTFGGSEPVAVHAATSFRSRLVGLAGRSVSPNAQIALLLPLTRSIHTVAMGFELDLVWLDSNGLSVRFDRRIGPRRLAFCGQASSVIELPYVASRAGRVLFRPCPPDAALITNLGGTKTCQRRSESQGQEQSQQGLP